MRKVKLKKIIAVIVLALMLCLTAFTLWGNVALEVTLITVQSENLPKSFDGFKIAHVSDLHNAEFGKDNVKLLEKIKSQNPDIIAITGDLVDSRRTKLEISLKFISQAVKIAPCYFVSGNHESRIDCYQQLIDGLISYGVNIIDESKTEIVKGEEKITVLGVKDPYFYGKSNTLDGEVLSSQLENLVSQNDGFTLLLSHRPELFEVYEKYDIDLTLCGHAHGGQFILPLIGGLYAPNQGIFPKFTNGLYGSNNVNMVVSRGLGNSAFPIRFNNPPEVVLITLKSKVLQGI